MLTKAASRKRAQRAYPVLPPCQHCGTTEKVQRHPPHHQNALSVVFLCRLCHAIAEGKSGKWGRGKRKIKVCVICGMEFTNYTHSRVKTCGKECLSEAGRRNANKRWQVGWTDLEDSVTR